jgi:HlyD family secretion protein
MVHSSASRALWLAAAVALVLISGCSQAAAPQAAPTAESAAAATAPAANLDTVSAKAVFAPIKEAALSYRVAGRVAEVLVAPGDAVKAGQELARLDLTDLEQAVRQAEAGLTSAEAQFAKLKAGASAEDIAEAEAAVSMAQAGIQSREAAVAIADANLAAARADLGSAQSGVALARSNIEAANARLATAQALVNKLVAGASAADLAIAEAEIERARNEQAAAQSQRDATFNLLEGKIGAAAASVSIAELQRNQLKAGARAEDVAAAKARSSQAAAGVQTARAELAKAQATAAEAQAAIKTREVQLAQAQAQLEGARAQLAEAQARLDLVKSGARAEDLAMAEAAVAEAQARAASAHNSLDDGTLRAPFDGTVGEILLREGEEAAPGVAALRMGDLSRFRALTEDLSEVDVDQVKVGQPARITVDALDGQIFDGKVTRVAPVASDRKGDKVYVVTVEPTAPPEDGLRWGMSAFVEIDVR